MDRRKLILIIGLALVLVAAASYWAGRPRDGDALDATAFDEDDHRWAGALDGVAGTVGGWLGQGPEEFDLDRLLPADGLSAIGECRPSRCEFRFDGSTQMRILRLTDGNGGFSRLHLRVSGPAEMRYEATSAEYDETPEATTADRDTIVDLPVDEAGGRIFFLGCGRLDGDCSVRFSRGED